MRGILFSLILAWILIGGGVTWLIVGGNKVEWLSPVAEKIFQVKKIVRYEVVGFLPPWQIDKANLYPEILDQLIFLGIEVKENGDLVWDSQSKKIFNTNYIAMKNRMKKSGKKNIIGIKLFNDKKIDMLLADEVAVNNLINQIKMVVDGNGYDGVNVDFEYMGDPLAVLEDEFANFLLKLREKTGKSVSVDVFANTMIKGGSGGVTKMVEAVDWVIVMAYDFVRPGMDFAGATAPIGSVPGRRNITEVVDRVVSLELPKEKVILAYPLYGYEFKTVDDTLGAMTIGGWGQTATMARVETVVGDNKLANLKLNWDEESLTPWLSYTEKETAYKTVKSGKKTKKVAYLVEVNYQIYYEDERSMEAKFNLIKQGQMGGVGFWALGYEGGNRKVWDKLELVLRSE